MICFKILKQQQNSGGLDETRMAENKVIDPWRFIVLFLYFCVCAFKNLHMHMHNF